MKRRQYRGRGGRVHADAHAGPSEPVQVQPPPQAYIRAYEAQLVDKTGPALIPWAGDESVLADRHNILHLLPDIPSPLSSLGSSSGSISSSWTVSSDAEEEFDLSGDEVAAYARTRRQKWVDGLRATRLAERERQDADEAERVLQAEEAERDESPPPDVAQLMAHTARSLAASPNATILVSKIMARHAKLGRAPRRLLGFVPLLQ
ncbi:hypothetical protein CcaverHIS631_0203890 [Cutaneotrichosporon cavernicola]|nr:hypothetical protein CcaverHIS631_0203890 [Cutaneotrichosporon cavernicola]